MSRVLQFVLFVALWRKFVLCSSSITEAGRALERLVPGNPQTQTLNLAYNHITTLGENVFQINSYRELSQIELQKNRLNHIHFTAFKGLRQLKTVDLSDNNLTYIDAFTFKFHPKLKKLDLAGNAISFNRLQVFLVSRSLQTLVLSRNRIEQIHQLTFLSVPNIRNLVLDNNPLYTIAAGGFQPLGNLQFLSLAHTSVLELSRNVFGNNLPTLVDLEDTPLDTKFGKPLKKVSREALAALIHLEELMQKTR